AGVVNAWHDRSPNAHRAFAPYIALRPTLISQGVGNHPGVAFAGKGDLLVIPDAPSLRFGSKNFIISVVIRHTTSVLANSDCMYRYGAIYVKSLAVSPFVGPSFFANLEFFDTSGSKGVYPVYGAQLDNTQAVTTWNDHVPYNDDVPRAVTMSR